MARRPARRRGARGLSLIELMVSMVLGLLLLAIVGQVYLLNKASFTAQEQQGLLQESGRFALEFLARDARMSGLVGCSSRRPLELPLPVRNYLNVTAYPFNVTQGVYGHEADGSGVGDTLALGATNPTADGGASDWTPALPTGTYSLVDSALPGSDVLVLSGMDPGIPLVAPFTSGAQIFVASTAGFARGDILLVTDCQQAQVFQATNVVAASGNITGSNAVATPGNASNISERGPTGPFQAGSEVARVRSYAYYVGRGASDAPALFRESLQRTASGNADMQPEELIDGVESMQVLYGIDGNHDYIVDAYVSADAVGDWQTVRALQVALLVRSRDDYTTTPDAGTHDVGGTLVDPVDDRRQRRVFTSTIALRNRLL